MCMSASPACSLLDAMVEEMRVDVAQRRCRVVSGEVEKLAESVGSLARGLLELKSELPWQPLLFTASPLTCLHY